MPTALLWTPPVATETQLLTFCLAAALLVLIVLPMVIPLFIALVLAGPATALLLWLLLWLREQQYKAALDCALPAVFGRLGTQLRSGSGIQPALEKVVAGSAERPAQARMELTSSTIRCAAAGRQPGDTPAGGRGAGGANTLTAPGGAARAYGKWARGETHDVLIKRVQAAYTALHAAEQRRSSAATELAPCAIAASRLQLLVLVWPAIRR